VVQALTDLGVFDHASWNAGVSGGAWYALAHALASMDSSTGMKNASAVFNDLKVKHYTLQQRHALWHCRVTANSLSRLRSL
jgi:hypothetical protein